MRALLVHAGTLGDFVMALRVVAALRASGASEVTVLGRAGIVSIALQEGVVDRVLDLESAEFSPLFHPDLKISEAARDQLSNHELVVLMAHSERSAVMARRLEESRGGRVITIDSKPQQGLRWHVTDQWLARLKGAGLNVDVESPQLLVDPKERAKIRRELIGSDAGRLILLHPGSGGAAKNWPVDEFIKAAQEIRSRRNMPAFVSGPVEEEMWGPEIKLKLQSCAPLIQNQPLAKTAALIASASLYIGNDSGATHLAAAIGTPTLAVFGATDPVIWRPLGRNVRVVRSETGVWPSAGDVAFLGRRMLEKG